MTQATAPRVTFRGEVRRGSRQIGRMDQRIADDATLEPNDYGIVAGATKRLMPEAFAKGLEYDDVESIGLVILLQARAAYDPTRGTSLRTWLYGQVYIRVKVYLRALPWRCSIANSDPWRIRARKLPVTRVQPLEVLDAGGQSRTVDVAAPPDPGPDEFDALLSKLQDRRERQVLRARFQEDLTFAEVGARVSLSGERARQIQERALTRLREVMEADA